MIYVFRAEDGEEVELPFTMAEAPLIGETVEVDGKTFKRVFCGRVGISIIAMHGKYPYLSSHMDPCGSSTHSDPRFIDYTEEVRRLFEEQGVLSVH